MNFFCKLHGWSNPKYCCPICESINYSTTSDSTFVFNNDNDLLKKIFYLEEKNKKIEEELNKVEQLNELADFACKVAKEELEREREKNIKLQINIEKVLTYADLCPRAKHRLTKALKI